MLCSMELLKITDRDDAMLLAESFNILELMQSIP